MTHAVLICSGKRHVAGSVLAHPSLTDLSVVTETGHPDLYSGHRVRTVASIEDVDAVLGAVLDLGRERPVDAVVTPYETGLPAGAYVRTMLGLPGIDFHTAAAFTDKYVMKRRASAAGVPVTPHALALDLEQAVGAAARLGLPVVLKPLYGGGSAGVAVCTSPDDVREWWQRHGATGIRPAALVERRAEILAEYHVDGIVLDGRTHFAVTSRYVEPMLETARASLPYASCQLPQDHPDSRVARALHDDVVGAFGLRDGVTHMELFRTPEGWLFSEVACRAAGGAIPEAIATRHGHQLFDVALRLAVGEPLPTPEAPTRSEAFVAHVALGVRPGTVTRISSPETFADVPGVVATDVRTRPGDVVPRAFYSATASGFVHVAADDQDTVARAVAEVRRRHVIETSDDLEGARA